MSDFKIDDFHKIIDDNYGDDIDLLDTDNFFKKINNTKINNNRKNKNQQKIIILGYIFILIAIWFALFINYAASSKIISKYNKELSLLSINIKNNSVFLDKLKNNLHFFKNIKYNQINISNLLYAVSIHKFPKSKLISIIVKDGKVYLRLIVYKKNFLNSLNNLTGYKVYLNMNKNKIFTGRFKIDYLIRVGKNKFKALLVSKNKK
ncbi:MAG: hypothetical protein ACYDDE_02210 [bacterium]